MSATAAQNATLTTQQQNATYPPAQESYPELDNGILLNPKEVELIWNSSKPLEDFANYAQRLIKKDVDVGSISQECYFEGENRFDHDEFNLIGEYCLQNLIFFKDEVKLTDNHTIAFLVNNFWDMTKYKTPQNYKQGYEQQGAMSMMNDFLRLAFQRKWLNRAQVKQIYEYAQRTYFKHAALIQTAIGQKRQNVDKSVSILLPQQSFAGNLQTNCKEIIEEKPEDQAMRSQHDFYQDETQTQQDGNGHDDEVESDVDPEDPLYGLDQRLRNMNLDDESRRIIKEKLHEASERVKNVLEDRQRNLDSKLTSEKGGAPKKK